MEVINNFTGGMSSDLSKTYHKPDTYLQAFNFRGTTEIGSSNGSLVNIKGNECKMTFPELQPVYKLVVIKGTNTSPTNIVTITINGTSTSFTIDNNTQGIDIYNYIIANFPECYQNTSIGIKTFAIAYEDNYIVFYQQPVYEDCGPSVASIPTTISISYSQVTTGAYPTLQFINHSAANSLTQGSTSYVKGNTNLAPIGSTFILDDIYILTAPYNILSSNDSFNTSGQIWKFNIDDITKQGTLTLIYSNNLDLTMFHPIAPSAIIGRYESHNIQRIYWTDFYNKIRNINVAQPQLMAMSPSLLYVFPAISFEVPILNSIISGSLTNGTYELCYRLKKAAGAITNYSQTSNMVHIIESNPNNDSSANFIVYEGVGNGVQQGIRWKVSNLDTQYDTVEYIVLYRNNKTNLPTIYVVPERNIGTLVDNFVEITDVSTYKRIDLIEFISLTTGFTHAKTVDTKDNRLFWGNVKYSTQSDISGNFDARAFRTKTPNADDIYVTNNGVSASHTLTYMLSTPTTNDNINEYYDSSGNEGSNACFYKPGSSVLGGKGANIEYEFGTENIKLSDKNITEDSANYWHIDGFAPFSNTAGLAEVTNPEDLIISISDSDNQVYPVSGVNGFKNPYITSVLKGFQHEEIYRFGIQFFDKQGSPFFTEWIGDIKMPSTADSNPASPTSDFRNSFLQGIDFDQNIIGQVLYVKFKVDISGIKDLIGGYQIVRCERTNEDKTILGSGMLTNSFSDGVSICLGGGLWRDNTHGFGDPLIPATLHTDFAYDPYPSQDSLETLGQDTAFNHADISDRVLTFDCFDFINNGTGGYSFKTGDKILIRSKVKPINRQNAQSGFSNGRYRKGFLNLSQWLTNPHRYNSPPQYSASTFISGKWQTGFDSDEMPYYILHYVESDVYASNNLNNHTISTGQNCAGGNTSVSVLGSYNFKNHLTSSWGPNTDDTVPGYGGKTVVLEFDNTFKIHSAGSPYFANATNGEKLMGLYYRHNANQYGGNTYSARTNSIYIACGSFIPVTRNNLILDNNIILDLKCFGGDIHLNYWDNQKIYKGSGSSFRKYDYDAVGGNNNPGSTTAISSVPSFQISNTYNFPCTNTANQSMRYGSHVDRNLTGNTFADLDEYNYQTFHSNEKNVITFFPKPLNFIINDEWRARIFFSEIKIDNEIEDSWSKYLPNSFYDVEGSYGQINALVSLKDTMYYFQERGIGMLMINPVSMITDTTGTPINLGNGKDVIEKHYYRAIDTGTSHQWSVYRSQSIISFVDVRHKKIYLFNGESVVPISDTKGQRNFVIKRLHNLLLNNDNPVIDRGIITTYDYYNNEFLYTFNNKGILGIDPNLSSDESLTLVYSEITDNFTGMYTFAPNLYINSNKYLVSTNRDSKLWFHNYGAYGSFYGTIYPSTLKVLINEHPMYSKVFDNISWMSDSVNDNIEWSDDLNQVPGSITSPSYPDDINFKDNTFDKVRLYNDYQNTDWTTLTLTPGSNLRRAERSFNLQVPRNKFDYDTNLPSTYSIFDTARLTKTTFGERLRDKWLNVDLSYNNLLGLRFVIHNLKTLFRISDR